MNQTNYKKINFILLTMLFSFSIIANEENCLSEDVANDATVTRSCRTNIVGPRGPRGLPGANIVPIAYGLFRNTNPQTGLTKTTPILFPEAGIDPVGMTLLPSGDGIKVENSGTYKIYYQATFLAEKNEGTDIFSVGSLAITVNGQVIEDSDQTLESNVADIVLAGDPRFVLSTWMIDLKAGDIIGLQGPSLFNVSATGKSNFPVLINVYRID